MFLVLVYKWIMQPEDTRHGFQENATAQWLPLKRRRTRRRPLRRCFLIAGSTSVFLPLKVLRSQCTSVLTLLLGRSSFYLLPLWDSSFLSQKLLERMSSKTQSTSCWVFFFRSRSGKTRWGGCAFQGQTDRNLV